MKIIPKWEETDDETDSPVEDDDEDDDTFFDPGDGEE